MRMNKRIKNQVAIDQSINTTDNRLDSDGMTMRMVRVIIMDEVGRGRSDRRCCSPRRVTRDFVDVLGRIGPSAGRDTMLTKIR